MKNLLLVLLIIVATTSCDRPECRNTNPVFAKYAPESNEYKAELIKQIKNTPSDKLTFWINKYSKKDSTDYMTVHVQGSALCAMGIFDITHAQSLGNYKDVKGMSYQGAELRGLKYRIDSTNGNYTFIFDDVAWIVD